MIHPYQSKWIRAENELVDTEHGVKIDFSSAIFNTNLGHANVAVADAIAKQLGMGFTNTYRHPTDVRERYIEALQKFFGAKKAYLFSTGAEAVEAAFLMASVENRQLKPIAMVEDGFHGKTMGSNNYKGRAWNIKRTDVTKTNLCDCLILEPYRPYDAHWHPDSFLKMVRQDYKTIIFDEVQSAFYRTGSRLAYTQYPDFQPDYVVLGKAMGNGFPMSAVLRFCEDPHPGVDYTSTYGGNPLACAAGLAVINQFNKNDFLIETKAELMANLLGQVAQGRGMCLALELGSKEDLFVKTCFERGVIVIPTGKGWVKLAPPLTIRFEKLLSGLRVIRGAYYDVM